MSFDDLRAQHVAVQTLKRAAQSGRVASAYLFEGPDGVGKELAARALAQALLCEAKPLRGCGACDTCKKIDGGSYADVRVFRPREEGDQNLQVEFIRTEVLPFTQYAPFVGKAAFLIFPEAHVSFPPNHSESANALLKTLEEPRPNVHFILTSERPDRLLSTIRSRCQRVRFGRLPALTLEQILKDRGVKEDKRADAIALADGSAARAMTLAESGGASKLFDAATRIDAVVEAGKPGGIIELASALGGDDDLVAILETLGAYYRDVAVAASGLEDDALHFRANAAALRARARTLSPARAASRVALLRETIASFERNVGRELALDTLFFELRQTV